eukprot:TRINITY_DN48858_c0_g1_i2.p2 TRINITY_DN48858_c0_g1~~TRINITY_DN48858_c0_g1_i2.p2  ORF type:complete len:122 (-),score=2.73 TRINITY_DN48858_c0_g1_i2:50-391(-)
MATVYPSSKLPGRTGFCSHHLHICQKNLLILNPNIQKIQKNSRLNFHLIKCQQTTSIKTKEGRLSSGQIKDSSSKSENNGSNNNINQEMIDLNPPKGTRDFPPVVHKYYQQEF